MPAKVEATLPDTSPLVLEEDLATRMVDGIHQFLDILQIQVDTLRCATWHQNYCSREAAKDFIRSKRELLAQIIGVVDRRLPVEALEIAVTTASSGLVGRGDLYNVYEVRWPVLEGVTGEGLLLKPDKSPVARIIAVPDADWSPDMLVGLSEGIPEDSQFARILTENGCEIVIPILIDRRCCWSGLPGVRMTNQTHREFLYRMSYELGRHIIGYEVQKILAVVDWFERISNGSCLPIGIVGYGEGGLLALYTAAIDTRIDAALVSGYFQNRAEMWKEPLYRNVWGRLKEFGDAELAGLIAPRTLIVEAARGPEIDGPLEETELYRQAAAPGRLTTPSLKDVQCEIDHAQFYFDVSGYPDRLKLVVGDGGSGNPGSEQALVSLFCSLGQESKWRQPGNLPVRVSQGLDPKLKLKAQFDQLIRFNHELIRKSPEKRAAFWSTADDSSPEKWVQSTEFHRHYIWEEVIGKLPSPEIPINPRSRLFLDLPEFTAYEIMLDVWPGVFTNGILVLPPNYALSGKKSPVVVCQHGLEGSPTDFVRHPAAKQLAQAGYVTYAPQNPYRGGDRFRSIQRKAHPLKLSLFSFIIGQHARTLEWLRTLAFVDSERIGFYGFSYGGKTAMRVPSLLQEYAMSICSADFNEWVWKTASADSRFSYLLTNEYDMQEFNFAHLLNYAELAKLIAPRPFMVERGHHDTTAPDEWVAYEYARVRHFYVTKMRLPERTEIEFFDGPHTINIRGTFDFMRRHLLEARK